VGVTVNRKNGAALCTPSIVIHGGLANMKSIAKPSLLALTAAVLLAPQFSHTALAADPHDHFGRPADRVSDGHGHFLDSRYNHGHYYPAVGASVRVLPEGYRPYFYGGHPFYFSAGVWYGPGPGGFVVVRPPVGLVVTVLPPYYSTVWIGGLPYYYANDVYYTWDAGQNAYVVAAPPANADQPSAAPVMANEDLIIYPKNGQSTEQQAADRYECHSWAKQQTGFDPTQPGGGVPAPNSAGARSAYDRAMSACLSGRGYEVK
jgi:hypothetical protein